jgi:hypothetical protein
MAAEEGAARKWPGPWCVAAGEAVDAAEDVEGSLADVIKMRDMSETEDLAVLDRPDLQSDTWRPVYLRLLPRTEEQPEEGAAATRTWSLVDAVTGTVLDEPGEGCPAAGFSETSLLDDLACYRLPTSAELAPETKEEKKVEEVVVEGDDDDEALIVYHGLRVVHGEKSATVCCCVPSPAPSCRARVIHIL